MHFYDFSTIFQDSIWEFALLCNERQIETSVLIICTHKQIWTLSSTCRTSLLIIKQGANSRTLPSTILDISEKNQFHWRKSYRTKYHKTHLCAMPSIASSRMHFPFASEAQYGSRYRSISFSRIASNNKLISYKSCDKLYFEIWAGFGLTGNL